jgi:uncharacterized RDD family membrane protein YckC
VKAPSVAQVPAERSTRLGAAIVDGLIFSAMVYLPMLLGTVVAASSGASADTALVFMTGPLMIGFIVWTWLTLKQMAATGQSLAKKYFNIKVVLSDGSPAPLSTLILRRNILNGILSMIPLYGFIEVLFIFGENRQCLHDRMADTIVVEA